MDVLLINSVNMQYKEVFRKTNSLPPLGLLYIAACLKEKRGYECEVFDFVVQEISKDELKKKVTSKDQLLVGISVYADSSYQAKEISDFIKKVAPNVKIVWGGAFPTFSYHDILKTIDSVDYVAIGEGEETLTELADFVLGENCNIQLSEIRGLAYKSNGEIKLNEKRPFIQNLDTLPYPARELVKPQIDKRLYALPYSIYTSRGCPGNCIFCSARAFWGSKVRFRSPQNVYEELLDMTKRFDTYVFHIVDDTFTARPSLVNELCNMIIESGNLYKWSCESRADVADADFFKKLYDAGCRSIQFGIESSSNKTLKSLKKKVTSEQIENAVRLAHEAGFDKIIGSFILGNYPDTIDDMRNTIKFCKNLRDKYKLRCVWSFNTPFPGTYQYDNLDKLGLKMHTIDFSELVLSKPHVSTANFDREDLQSLFFEAADVLL